jgi:hypothetical protein
MMLPTASEQRKFGASLRKDKRVHTSFVVAGVRFQDVTEVRLAGHLCLFKKLKPDIMMIQPAEDWNRAMRPMLCVTRKSGASLPCV